MHKCIHFFDAVVVVNPLESRKVIYPIGLFRSNATRRAFGNGSPLQRNHDALLNGNILSY